MPARGVFGSRLGQAEAYAALLASAGVERGLIGPREVPRLWERHLLNCAVLTELLEEGTAVCDLGSGAGLPGLVLAIRRPDLRVTLVEPLLRRVGFLTEAVTSLALDNVEVVRARAEELHGCREFPVLTARAVAPLDRLLGWALPLTRRGGVLLAMKGATAADELASAGAALARYGAGRSAVVSCGAPGLQTPTTVVRVEAGVPSRLGWEPERRGGSRSRNQRERGRRR